MKKIEDLNAYKGILPYASEMFGVYQPLLGWKSKRIEERFRKGFLNDQRKLLETLAGKFKPNTMVDFTTIADCTLNREGLQVNPGVLLQGEKKVQDSQLLDAISKRLPVYEKYKESVWDDLINPDRIQITIKEFVEPYYMESYKSICADFVRLHDVPGMSRDELNKSLAAHLNYESSLAGALLHFKDLKNFNALKSIFYSARDNANAMADMSALLNSNSISDTFLNIENIDPRNLEQLKSVGLSPLSIVHLFRQYFFELDTFLGSPVGHIWLSPGSTVELIEVSTRKTITEKSYEQATESRLQYEGIEKTKDDLSDSVTTDNRSETKFGANANLHQGWIGGEANASASLDMNTTQQEARVVAYSHMKEQSKQLSSEIRQNYKSTFKTITEVTDTSSKRYVLTNNTPDLLNYELRRKMRQVGVQVQDIGTYLCWQAYVDDPGAQLGISELIHIAKEPDVEGKPQHPAKPDLPKTEIQVVPLPIPFIGKGNDNDDKGELYINGKESNGEDLYIETDFPQSYTYSQPHYNLTDVAVEPVDEVIAKVIDLNKAGNGKFILRLANVHFHDKNAVNVKLKLKWEPDATAYAKVYEAAITKYQNDLKDYNIKVEREARKEFVNAVKERVTLASKITARKYEELREEERIVVYRKLIQEMLYKGISMPDDQTRHVVAELINSIFDVDKMLYFVAPEWWRPRLHHSHQNLGKFKKPNTETPPEGTNVDKETWQKIAVLPGFANKILNGIDQKRETPLKDNVTGWGGLTGDRDDNYYITENSFPARLGSSLGWLMQLDGDNLRNAFLNAPWVKAVMPIRPGKEEAALNWLQKVEGTNGIGNDFFYHTSNAEEKSITGQPLNGMPMLEVLHDLAKKVNQKYNAGLESGKYPKQDLSDPEPEPIDPKSVVTATPVDRVYEHGFYPLNGGFRSKVSAGNADYSMVGQWVEVLPTDQVVAVEVEYDAKTGRQK